MTGRWPHESWTAHVGDLAFTMTAPERWAEQQRHYLAQYLPGRLGDRDLGAFHLEVHPDDEECRRIAWQATRPPIARRIELVPGVVLLEKRTASGARCYAVAADGVEHQATAHAVRLHDRHIELYVHSSARKPYGYALRLMREAMLRTYEDHSGVVFHAAGADLDGHGVLICGSRSAGKTTVLTGLVRSTQSGVLANDRLILAPDRRLIAVPLPVSVARGSLEAIPELARMAPHLSRPQTPLKELPTRFGATDKAEFSAREYATALGTSLAAGSWLRTILVPHVTDSCEPARIRPLPAHAAQQVLAANCFTPDDEFWQQTWLVPRRAGDGDLRRHAVQLTQHISQHTPCFEVRFGVRNRVDELEAAVREAVMTPR